MPQRQIVFVGVPHPATRCVFAILAGMLAAEDVGCDLRTSSDGASGDDLLIYLRADASSAAALVAADRHAGVPREACRLAARLDEAWHHLPTISLDMVLNDPPRALLLLAQRSQVKVGNGAADVLHAQEATMRAAAALIRHPINYFGQVEHVCVPEQTGSGGEERLNRTALEGLLLDHGFSLINPGSHRHEPLDTDGFGDSRVDAMLVIAPDAGIALTGLAVAGSPVIAGISINDLSPGTVGHDDDRSKRLPHAINSNNERPDLPARFDRIYLYDLAAQAELIPLWHWATSLLAPSGIILGQENSADVVPPMLSSLMRMGDPLNLTFLLNDCRWTAVPAASWKA